MIDENDEILNEIIAYLKSTYQVHTIIIYGSRARNETTNTSDYDILAVRKHGEYAKECRIFKGFYLDAFIYSEEAILQPDNYMIRIKDGIVLSQHNNIGDFLLTKIKKLYKEGPKKTPDWERNEIKIWVEKMLNRSIVNDIEGNFRLHWLLYDLLECYFKLRDLWYLGPKESFKWLKENDLTTYEAFDKALKLSTRIQDVNDLVKRIVSL